MHGSHRRGRAVPGIRGWVALGLIIGCGPTGPADSAGAGTSTGGTTGSSGEDDESDTGTEPTGTGGPTEMEEVRIGYVDADDEHVDILEQAAALDRVPLAATTILAPTKPQPPEIRVGLGALEARRAPRIQLRGISSRRFTDLGNGSRGA